MGLTERVQAAEPEALKKAVDAAGAVGAWKGKAQADNERMSSV